MTQFPQQTSDMKRKEGREDYFRIQGISLQTCPHLSPDPIWIKQLEKDAFETTGGKSEYGLGSR